MNRKRKLSHTSNENFDDNISTDFLFQLVKSGQVDELKKYKTDLLVKNENGDTLLHKSLEKSWIGKPGVFCDHLEMVTYLLNTSPELSRLTNRAGETALCFACKNILLPEIRTLVEIYPTDALDIVDQQGSAPLHHLLESQFAVNNLKMLPNMVMSEDLNTSAVRCKENEILNLIQLLINKGANINIKNRADLTPLLCLLKYQLPFSEYFYNSAAKLLMENGAIIDINALLHVQTMEIAKIIMDKIDINYIDNENRSVLHNMMLTRKIYAREEIIKILVEKNCKITDKESDIIQLALDNNCEFSTIKTILEKYKGHYDINIRGECDHTVLTKFCKNMPTYKMLINLGANPTVVTYKGYSLLVTAVKVCNIEMVKLLIKLGLDPLEYDYNNDENNLSIICENIIGESDTQNYLYKKINLLKYFIKLPQFENILNKEKLFKYYSYLLNKLCKFYNTTNCTCKIRVLRILHILFYETNIKTLILNNNCTNINISLGSYLVVYASNYDILSSMFIIDTSIIIDRNDNNTDEFIHTMIDAGYGISKIPNCYVTALTVYLLFVKTETQSQINLINAFIDQGVNVESNVLQLRSNTIYSYDTLISFKNNYFVPDVLLLSLVHNQEKLFKIFIQYWWGSPLSLLCYKNRCNVSEFVKWYLILATYGGVPHGTAAFRLYYQFVANWLRILSTRPVEVQTEISPVLRHFQIMKKNPLSLRELAKYTVRLRLAAKASEPGNNLPDLLRQLLDPTLQFLLLHDN